MTVEEIAAQIVGMHTDKAFDTLIKHDMKWRIVKMNFKSVGMPKDQVPNRVLLDLVEEKVVGAQVG